MLSVYGCRTKKDLKAHVCHGDGAGCHDTPPAPAPMTIGAVLAFKSPAPKVPRCGAADRLQETSMFGPEYKGAGRYPVVGPSPYERKWYATVTVDDGGKIVKVS